MLFTKICIMLGIVTFVVGIAFFPFIIPLIKQKQQPHTTKAPVQTTIEEPQSPPPTTPATLQVQEVFVNGPIQLCTMKDNTNDKEYIIIVGNTGVVTITPRIPKDKKD